MAHKNLISRLLGSDPEVSQPYPELESRAKSLLDALMKEAVPSGSTRWENIKIGPLKSYERIKSESPELKKSLIFFIVKHKNNQDRKDSGSLRTYTSYRQSINSPVKEIESWRDFLYEKQIQQPFKQAFREIYLVTEAELQTESYSNRFAAHILRQHQFNALCQVRGWLYTLMGQWDSHNIPTRIIPAWDIRAEYWVDSDWDDADSMANQMGVFNYISTDQVRFYAQERQLNMDEVPSMVFSEVMRDVDLFVRVTSIGNDPNWVDILADKIQAYV